MNKLSTLISWLVYRLNSSSGVTVSCLHNFDFFINFYLYYFIPSGTCECLSWYLDYLLSLCIIVLLSLRCYRIMCNSPTFTDCLITWQSCRDLIFFVAVTLSIFTFLLIPIIYLLDSWFLVRLTSRSCPFSVQTRRPFLICFFVFLINRLWPFLKQGVNLSWYRIMLGVSTWCIYWVSLVIESFGEWWYEHYWHLEL